jgi:hypothetical protein
LNNGKIKKNYNLMKFPKLKIDLHESLDQDELALHLDHLLVFPAHKHNKAPIIPSGIATWQVSNKWHFGVDITKPAELIHSQLKSQAWYTHTHRQHTQHVCMHNSNTHTVSHQSELVELSTREARRARYKTFSPSQNPSSSIDRISRVRTQAQQEQEEQPLLFNLSSQP